MLNAKVQTSVSFKKSALWPTHTHTHGMYERRADDRETDAATSASIKRKLPEWGKGRGECRGLSETGREENMEVGGIHSVL